MKAELKAYPVPIKDKFTLSLPAGAILMGLETRSKAGAPEQIFLIALVCPIVDPVEYSFVLFGEDMVSEVDALKAPVGFASLKKPKPKTYAVFRTNL